MVHVDLRTAVSEGLSDRSALACMVAEHAIAIRFDDIPADVVALAKIHFRDQLGVGLLAATLARNRPLAALASAFGAGGNATALGCAAPVMTAAAALANGALMHSLEYDATHTASITHAGSVVAPVALAGGDVLAACRPRPSPSSFAIAERRAEYPGTVHRRQNQGYR